MMLCVLSETTSLAKVVQSIFNMASYTDFLKVYKMWVSIMNVCIWNFCRNTDNHTPECVPPKFRWHSHVFFSHFIYFCLLVWGRLVIIVASFRLAGIMISKGVLFSCPLSVCRNCWLTTIYSTRWFLFEFWERFFNFDPLACTVIPFTH